MVGIIAFEVKEALCLRFTALSQDEQSLGDDGF
jgi:hypothetical protein